MPNNLEFLLRDKWDVWYIHKDDRLLCDNTKRVKALYPSDEPKNHKPYKPNPKDFKRSYNTVSIKFEPLLNLSPGLGLFNMYLNNTQIITWFQDTFGRYITSWFLMKVNTHFQPWASTTIALWAWKHVQLCNSTAFPFNTTWENIRRHPCGHRDSLTIISTGTLHKNHYVDPQEITAVKKANETWNMSIKYIDYLIEIGRFRGYFDALPGDGCLQRLFRILFKYKMFIEHREKLIGAVGHIEINRKYSTDRLINRLRSIKHTSAAESHRANYL